MEATVKKFVPLTKMFLDEFGQIPQVLGDRKLNEKKVDRYLDLMISGKWRPDAPLTLANCKEVQTTFRVNGNHTHEAAKRGIESGSIKDGQVSCVYQVFDLDTMEQVLDMWRSFDKPDQSRTGKEITHATVQNSKTLSTILNPSTGAPLTETQLSRLASAWDMIDGTEYTHSTEERLKALEENKDEAQEVADIVFNEKVTCGYIVTPILIAMVWLTLRDTKQKGYNKDRLWKNFWIPICCNATGSLAIDDPRFSMAKWFNRQPSQPKAAADRKEWKNRITRAYNYFSLGKPLKQSARSKNPQKLQIPNWPEVDKWPKVM